jgi:hypothetical protein
MSVSGSGNVIVTGNVIIVTGIRTKWEAVAAAHIDATRKMLNTPASVPATRRGHAVTIGSKTSGTMDMMESETETETENLGTTSGTEQETTVAREIGYERHECTGMYLECRTACLAESIQSRVVLLTKEVQC